MRESLSFDKIRILICFLQVISNDKALFTLCTSAFSYTSITTENCGWYSKHDDAKNCLLNFDFMGIVNNISFFYECNRGVWPKIFFLLKTQIIRETQTTSWPSGFISWRHPVSMAEALCEIPCFVINNNCYKCYCWGFFGHTYRVFKTNTVLFLKIAKMKV